MRLVRFLFQPRWIGLFIVVVLLGLLCLRLSQWQFHRYRERHDDNAVVQTNLAATPAPLTALLSTTAEPASANQWRRVSVSGQWDASGQLAVLYRSRGGHPGDDVITPLVTSNGTAVLVDRGWVSAPGDGNVTPRLPAPGAGQVHVTAWVRVDATDGASATVPTQGSVRSVAASVIRLHEATPLYLGWLMIDTESPASPHAPSPWGPPNLSGGPSFFYGWQWIFFALMFAGFFIYFARAEYFERVLGKARPGTSPSPALVAKRAAEAHAQWVAEGQRTAAPTGPTAIASTPEQLAAARAAARAELDRQAAAAEAAKQAADSSSGR